MLVTTDFFNLDGFEHKSLFYDSNVEYVWDVLRLLGHYMDKLDVPESQGKLMKDA